MKIDVRKKILNVAVASAIGAAGVASLPAHAINVSQNNVGEVLLFPYYTVKNGYDTVFTVTNTTNRTVVAKIRWREALNSRETRDFNIVLSPFDVWTAGVTKDAAGTGALVRTYDNTCTSPMLPASATAAGSREIAFTSLAYDGTDANPAFAYDNGGKSIERTQEGYFEVISMGEFAAGDENNPAADIPFSAKHVAGVPRDCAYVGDSVAGDYAALLAPSNALKGAVSYIDVATGKAIDATPTTIESFASTPIWALPGDLNPDLADGDVGMTAYYLNDGTPSTTGPIANSADAVSVLLMTNALANEFVASGTAVKTDWVITYPTKHHYTDGLALRPFGSNFRTAGRSCNTISPVLYNREEGTVTPSGNSFSPAPTGSAVSMCYEANIITFNGGNVFGTGTNRLSIDTSAVGSSGWAYIGLAGVTGTGAMGVGGVTTTNATVSGFAGAAGLPAIGFAAVVRNNASNTSDNRNYGSTVEHSKFRM